jgi:GH35 family endo-1,4-beta-xylanase
MGEKQNRPFQLSFNASLKIDFQGSRVTSDGGLILVRELDERMGFGDLITQHLTDSRKGKNTRLPLADLFRQSVYSRIAGYEDVNDAERLAQDPTFRLIGSVKTWDRGAALTSRLQTFETEMLAEDENFGSLARINRELVGKAEAIDAQRRMVLDMDSTEIPVYGKQENSAYNGHFESTCYHPGRAGLGAGEVFLEDIEKTGLRDFRFCERRESSVLQGRKRLREKECGPRDQRMAFGLILNEILKSKMEVPIKSLHMAELNRRQLLAAAGLALSARSAAAVGNAAARCLVYDHQGQPLPAEAMRRFHLCDLKMRPFTLEPKISAGEIQFLPPPDRPFRIAVPLRVPGFGEVFAYADNQGAGYTSKSLAKTTPLVLNHAFAVDRLATVRRLAAECSKLGVVITPDIQRRIDAAAAALERAEAAKADPAALARLSTESFRESLWAGDGLVFARAQARIAKQGPRPGFLFGCNGFGMTSAPYRQLYKALFNYTTMPIYRGEVEPQKGHPDYSRLEGLLDALAGTTILPKIHPLIFLVPEATPEWEKNLPYEETKKLVVSRVRESVARFRHRVHIYDVVNEAHVQPETGRGMAGFTREQNVDMTVEALRAARDEDPTCFRIVNATGTWADYYMSRNPGPWQQSPYDYFKMLFDAKGEFETIGLQYYHSGRDLLEFERDLETFQDLGKPMHITELGIPSSSHIDPKNEYWGGGVGGARMLWHGDEFTETVQADWAEQIYTVAYSKPWLKAISWWDFTDQSFIAYGALVREDGTPKESYKRLQALFAKWRQV